MSATWRPGVVSATFKMLPADEVIRLAAAHHLEAIEWSEIAHVQPDDPSGAAELLKKTKAAGLKVVAYGSYYKLGENDDPEQTFLKSLRSAVALHAPLIRVWAGTKPSNAVSQAERAKIVKEAQLISDLAAKEGITVVFEWHKNTLTDTNTSALALLDAINRENVKTLWQPTVALSPAQRVEGIRLLGNRLTNFHVYSWPDGKRGPLNAAEWKLYLDAVPCEGTHWALLEFVRDNTPEQFAEDAARLIDLLKNGGYYG